MTLRGFFTDGFMSERMGVGLQIAEELFTLVLRSLQNSHSWVACLYTSDPGLAS